MSFRNSFLVLLFGGTLGMFLLREQQRGTLEWFDGGHREFLKANPASGQPALLPAAAAVIFGRLDDVDQKNRVFETWHLGQSDWQVVLQNLSGYQPKAVAVAAPLPFDKADSALDAAAKGIPRLITAAPTSVAAGDGGQTLPDGLPVLKVTGSVRNIPEFKSIRPPALSALPAAGDIDMLPRPQAVSIEGDWCRVPMLARLGDKVVPSLALRALLEWASVPAAEVTVQPGVAITAGKSLRIPIDDGGFFRYFLSLAPDVPALNADIFALTRDQALSNLPPDDPQRSRLAALPQSLLWIGHDNVSARLLKHPNGTLVSPAFLTASALAAVQTARYMHPLPPSHQWIAPAATLLFCLWLTHWRKSRLWIGAFLAAVVLAGVSLYLYRTGDLWTPLVPSLAMLAATLVLSFLLPARGAQRSPVVEPPKTRTRTAVPSVMESSRSVSPRPIRPATVPEGESPPLEEDPPLPVEPAPPADVPVNHERKPKKKRRR